MAEAPHTRIDRARLRKAGVPGPDGITWAMRLGAVAFVIALGVIGWVLLAPITPTAQVSAPELPSIDAIVWPENLSASARGSQLSEMSARHVFSKNRNSWGVQDNSAVTEAPSDVLPELPTAFPTTAESAAMVVTVDDLEEVDTQIKASFQTIRLKSISNTKDDQPAATLAFTHSKSTDQSMKVIEGDQFIVPRAKGNGEDQWMLLRVDVKRNRIYVRLESTTLGVALFPDDTIESGEVSIAGAPASSGDVAQAVSGVQVAPIDSTQGQHIQRVERMDRAVALDHIRRRAEELEDQDAITFEDLAELMALTAEGANAPKADDGSSKSQDSPKE